ncbi:hypothetical protein [Novosphingobium mangrovi (ex Huang et al. 2023)]|uniref:Lipoprotein n=1 Tax=Novosphingobium mangrovi (ex Huang et al. 2023) TaxID=2976432 RepID=A0ABT2I7N5_9SPHN|nr:hypothetical protein [Novosphingobium mangrovi (ex Huang et al. 2023)]MCT2400829.1 hypothetical protein [Novosphingobium mangrovi (ex Huang et al. 2023)]
MKRAAAFALAACGLVAACKEAPPRPPAMSDAEIGEVARQCGVPASAISIREDKVIFDPPGNISYDSSTCVLKELRARVPSMPIGFGGQERSASERPGQ